MTKGYRRNARLSRSLFAMEIWLLSTCFISVFVSLPLWRDILVSIETNLQFSMISKRVQYCRMSLHSFFAGQVCFGFLLKIFYNNFYYRIRTAPTLIFYYISLPPSWNLADSLVSSLLIFFVNHVTRIRQTWKDISSPERAQFFLTCFSCEQSFLLYKLLVTTHSEKWQRLTYLLFFWGLF